jgi:hypothetical protein
MIIIDQIVKMASFPSTIEQVISLHISSSNQGSGVHKKYCSIIQLHNLGHHHAFPQILQLQILHPIFLFGTTHVLQGNFVQTSPKAHKEK